MTGSALTRLLVAAVLLGSATLTAAPSQASTVRRHFTPFNDQGEIKSSYHVQRRSGDCNSSSFVDGRPDAWRCFTGNYIRDPCFESPVEADVAVCANSPWG